MNSTSTVSVMSNSLFVSKPQVQSRPATARPLTAASSRHEGSFVVAVLEGRGVGREVGIAALDKDTGQIVLNGILVRFCLFCASSLIAKPTSKLCTTCTSITRHSCSFQTPSLQCIQEEFLGVPIEPVLRKYWNEDAGLQFINQLCVDSEDRAATLLAVSSKYYTLSAACALFKHAEMKLNTRYAAHSLRIRYTPVEGTMLIDNDSARNLELVGNMLKKKSAHSLFGTLNHTWTAMGARLLRVNLLAPITAHNAIDARLDAVEELVQSEDKFNSIKDALRTVNRLDLDKLISSLAASEARVSNGAKAASSRVSQMLHLRSVVKNVPLVRDAVRGCGSRLLEIVCDMLSDERMEKIENLIAQSLNENTTSQKGGGLNAMNARVYAVKVNYNCLLDVARETYKENHDLPLQLVHQEHGFVFTLRKADLEEAGKTELPKGFVNVTAKKGKWFFESIDLKKRNARMKDALDETLLLSGRIIQDLVTEVIVEVGALYKASEAIALLDMLWSFAHASILRPEFTGTLAIKAGRHPILETVQSAGTLVPNDVYCCDTSSFQIIQGPNTYLRQTGLLTVMAMCGCFVPAEYASFRIHDALLTRLSNDDDIERSLSTFAEEMSSSAMILGLSTTDSLILIDELGRGTSPREGLGISHAIAERLIRIKAFVFFATHFSDVATSLSRQPSVVNLHLSVQVKNRVNIELSVHLLTFRSRIIDGVPDNIDHYGDPSVDFLLFSNVWNLPDWPTLPDDVLSEARKVATQDSEGNQVVLRRKAMLRLRTQLTQAP
ncbi:muts domain V-domain-containing protein [Phellopilus nigrolimitatus]|nr:muts domain V-domain-containing protein [Phellopilus nigrolimitatus]